ncbi:MAG: AMP-dependent synthetase/ligase [Nostocoides sp.]
MTMTPLVTVARIRDEVTNSVLLNDRPASVGALFRNRANAAPGATAFMYATTDSAGEDTWHSVTWRQAQDRVYPMAAGLIDLGIDPEDRVALASGTRYEWALADLAVMCAGGATTTIYPSTIPEDVAFILSDSGSKLVFAEDDVQLDKLIAIRDQIPSVSAVVLLSGEVPVTAPAGWVLTLQELSDRGVARLEAEPEAVDARIEASKPDHLATLMYTSGTTGRPKGVRLLHSTWTYQGAACAAINILTQDDLQYLWLPLSHVFGKQLLTINLAIGFPTAIDGRIDKIVDNLAVVHPTFMGAAPRIFEKAHARITQMMAAEGGVKAKLFDWSIGVGDEVARLREQGKDPGGLLAIKHAVADKLVLSKLRERFGGNIRFFISGSAALNSDIARWFAATGMLIAQGYGLTETSSAAYVNRVVAYRTGSVGWALPGLETQIAPDGEVLLRGEGVMAGYHNNPDATAEAIDADGWFHTGDIGELDDRGFLTITDRKKDLFKTSGGKYVAPSVIESTFKGLCPYVSQMMVYGDQRNFVTALIALDPEAMLGWATAHGMDGAEYAEVVSSDKARAMVQGYVDELNAGLNRWETIKKFVILDHDLSVESGELTPSLKLKRKVVTVANQDALNDLYAS